MYVEWLHKNNQKHFIKLIQLLHKGNTVEEAMLDSYQFSVMEGWKRFVNETKTFTRTDQSSTASAMLQPYLF
jgi:hypothetical protein